jgi:hypothetical protein
VIGIGMTLSTPEELVDIRFTFRLLEDVKLPFLGVHLLYKDDAALFAFPNNLHVVLFFDDNIVILYTLPTSQYITSSLHVTTSDAAEEEF